MIRTSLSRGQISHSTSHLSQRLSQYLPQHLPQYLPQHLPQHLPQYLTGLNASPASAQSSPILALGHQPMRGNRR
jgi:hypothetical protein